MVQTRSSAARAQVEIPSRRPVDKPDFTVGTLRKVRAVAQAAGGLGRHTDARAAMAALERPDISNAQQSPDWECACFVRSGTSRLCPQRG